MKINYLTVKVGVAPDSYWDQTFIKDLLEDLPEGDRKVFLVPGAYQGDVIDKINKELQKHEKVMVFITSDEEGKFDCSKLEHPDMIHYCQYGHCENLIPLGYTPHTKKAKYAPKVYDWFFAGQINHTRREKMGKVLEKLLARKATVGLYVPTDGFAKGLSPERYIEAMAGSKVVLCPSGNVSHSSFRVYEALECGAVPIVDEFNVAGETGYWQKMFSDAPFPILTSYDELPYLIEKYKDKGPEVYAWWISKKQEIKEKLAIQLGCPVDATTAVVVTSPIKSHPDTGMMCEALNSVKHHLDCKIVIGFDGVRDEQKDFSERYSEYINRMLWMCNFKYSKTVPVLFKKHKHQSGMMKKIMPMIKTPLLLFVEHDTPLVVDEPIDFPYLQRTLLTGHSFLIRFHFEASIPKEHEYMIIGKVENRLLKTYQWSQRPHLARTDFYTEVIKFFSEDSNCFIEDLIHGKVIDAWMADEMKGWDKWRMHIYIPGENIKRSLNLDGRGSDYKYEKEQKW